MLNSVNEHITISVYIIIIIIIDLSCCTDFVSITYVLYCIERETFAAVGVY